MIGRSFASSVALLLTVAVHSQTVSAAEQLEGYFIALDVCDAFQSKNKLTNPGNVETEPDHAYRMIAINKPGGDYFQVRIPGAPVTTDRWVHVSCGVHVVEAGAPVADGGTTGGVVVEPPPGAQSEDNLLALSWQPAFCETRPDKPECRLLNDGDLAAAERQLSIHGLWPQPRGNEYCGVPKALVDLDNAGRWSQLPEVEMDDDTREALQAAMPGTMSFLERHEWIKHGTCYKAAGGSDEYFDDMLWLVDAINGSVVGEFFDAHVGAEVATQDIRTRFDQAFGQGAGDRVQFHCVGDGGRTLIQELQISLLGVIEPGASTSGLLLAAEPVSIGCQRGVLDPIGLQ